MKTTDEADLIERIAEALSIQQRPSRAWSECSPSTESYWRAQARAVLPILTDISEALSQIPTKVVHLIRDLTDPDDCWFDHGGGCQAHGYLSLTPDQECPHSEAKRLLADQIDQETTR